VTRRADCSGCLHLLAAAGGRTVVVVVVPGCSSEMRSGFWGRFWAWVGDVIEALIEDDWSDQ
jgi:hypothetical protein